MKGDRIQLTATLEANTIGGRVPAGRYGTVTYDFGDGDVIAWLGEEWNGRPQGRLVPRSMFIEVGHA